ISGSRRERLRCISGDLSVVFELELALVIERIDKAPSGISAEQLAGDVHSEVMLHVIAQRKDTVATDALRRSAEQMISEQSLRPLWHRGGRAGCKNHGEEQGTPVSHLPFPILGEASRARSGKYLRRCACGQAAIPKQFIVRICSPSAARQTRRRGRNRPS